MRINISQMFSSLEYQMSLVGHANLIIKIIIIVPGHVYEDWIN